MLLRQISKQHVRLAELLTGLLRSWALQQAGNINLKTDEKYQSESQDVMRQDNIKENICFFFLTAKLTLRILHGANGAYNTELLIKGFYWQKDWGDHSNQIVHAARKWSHGHTELIKNKNHGLCGTSKLKMLKKWIPEIIWIILLKNLFKKDIQEQAAAIALGIEILLLSSTAASFHSTF